MPLGNYHSSGAAYLGASGRTFGQQAQQHGRQVSRVQGQRLESLLQVHGGLGSAEAIPSLKRIGNVPEQGPVTPKAPKESKCEDGQDAITYTRRISKNFLPRRCSLTRQHWDCVDGEWEERDDPITTPFKEVYCKADTSDNIT